jgi:hypothetical protein
MDLFELLESKAVWTIDELQPLLNISNKTLYKHATCGKLPAFRIGTFEAMSVTRRPGCSGCVVRTVEQDTAGIPKKKICYACYTNHCD